MKKVVVLRDFRDEEQQLEVRPRDTPSVTSVTRRYGAAVDSSYSSGGLG